MMNNRIKELAVMSGFNDSTFAEKTRLNCFAQLLIEECISIILKEHDEGLDRHGDYQLGLYEAYREIKEHFRVE